MTNLWPSSLIRWVSDICKSNRLRTLMTYFGFRKCGLGFSDTSLFSHLECGAWCQGITYLRGLQCVFDTHAEVWFLIFSLLSKWTDGNIWSFWSYHMIFINSNPRCSNFHFFQRCKGFLGGLVPLRMMIMWNHWEVQSSCSMDMEMRLLLNCCFQCQL